MTDSHVPTIPIKIVDEKQRLTYRVSIRCGREFPSGYFIYRGGETRIIFNHFSQLSNLLRRLGQESISAVPTGVPSPPKTSSRRYSRSTPKQKPPRPGGFCFGVRALPIPPAPPGGQGDGSPCAAPSSQLSPRSARRASEMWLFPKKTPSGVHRLDPRQHFEAFMQLGVQPLDPWHHPGHPYGNDRPVIYPGGLCVRRCRYFRSAAPTALW